MTEHEYLQEIELIRPQLVEAALTKAASPADAEDAVQDAIWYCLRHLRRYDPKKASLKTWVSTVVMSRALDNNYMTLQEQALTREPDGFDDTKEIRKIKNADKIHDWPRRAQAKPKAPQEPGYDPKYDLVLSVHQAVATLPQEEQAIARLVLTGAYTWQEYAKLAGISMRTAARRVTETKARLRKLLKEWRD